MEQAVLLRHKPAADVTRKINLRDEPFSAVGLLPQDHERNRARWRCSHLEAAHLEHVSVELTSDRVILDHENTVGDGGLGAHERILAADPSPSTEPA